MNNAYGLDVSYTQGKLELVLRDLDRYTPDELARELGRICGDTRVDELERQLNQECENAKEREIEFHQVRRERDDLRAQLNDKIGEIDFSDRYVIATERDVYDPLKSEGAIVHETMLGKADALGALERADKIGTRYGERYVCRLSLVGTVDQFRALVENQEAEPSYCLECDKAIADASLLVITDAAGNRVCSEDCRDEANHDIARDQEVAQ